MEMLIPEVKSERFSLTEPGKYMLYGLWPTEAKAYAKLNGTELKTEIEAWTAFSAIDRFDVMNSKTVDSVVMSVYLPEKLPDGGMLRIWYEKDGGRSQWFSVTVQKLREKNKNPQVFIDQVRRDEAIGIAISGWVASDAHVDIYARDEKDNEIVGQIARLNRTDVKAIYTECDIGNETGFQLVFKNVTSNRLFVVFKAHEEEVIFDVALSKGGVLKEDLKKYSSLSLEHIKKHGFRSFFKKALKKIGKKDGPVEYREWIKHNFASEEQLNEQRETKFDYSPLISIVVPLYKTNKLYLDALIKSVQAQTYGNWEICLSDGSGSPSPIAADLEAAADADKRIKIIPAGVQRRIVENTNRAIEAASGEYIAFADHDDLLAPDALFEVVKALNENSEYELIYSDEDKVNESGNMFFEPHMKPDFNPDLLRTVNYICHLCVIKRGLLDKTGYLNPEYEGAQDYDIILRATENTKNIHHIPKVLYHWRSHQDSTAENPESKRYAFDAGRRAVADHYKRLGIKAEVIDGEWPGLYRTKYLRDYDPLISILIPNKDHTDDLKRCIDSLFEKSTYKNFEIIVIENNSDKDETFEYYKEAEKQYDRVRVVYYDGGFNFSAINNFGAEHANGEYLLLLNNDTGMINEDALEELLGYCMRDDTGIVGARLYYEDDTIQHAGVVVGFGGIAGHCFVMHPRGNTGYCHRIICAQDYSAVTAACMMVDRKVFDEVGGLDPFLAVAFNDIDFCLRVREAGYYVVYNPYAEFYHYESKSRGLEDTPEKMTRFNQECEKFFERWQAFLDAGDPFYNPNLTLDSQDFSLKKNF